MLRPPSCAVSLLVERRHVSRIYVLIVGAAARCKIKGFRTPAHDPPRGRGASSSIAARDGGDDSGARLGEATSAQTRQDAAALIRSQACIQNDKN